MAAMPLKKGSTSRQVALLKHRLLRPLKRNQRIPSPSFIPVFVLFMPMRNRRVRSADSFERVAVIDHGPISHNLTVIAHLNIMGCYADGLILTDRDPFHHHPELRGKIKPASESFFCDWDLSASTLVQRKISTSQTSTLLQTRCAIIQIESGAQGFLIALSQ